MTYDQREARIAELKAEYPNGLKSNSEIERIVDREELVEQIEALPDHTDYRIEIKNIFRALERFL